MAAIKILILLIASLLGLGVLTLEAAQFRPITDGINFRANYRIQTFIEGMPISTSDVYESYHFTLATGLIRQTIMEEDRTRSSHKKNTFKYLYDSRARRLVEFGQEHGDENLDDADELFHDDFYLPENGCTNSYQCQTYSTQAVEDRLHQSNEYLNSVRVLPKDTTLDSRLLMADAELSSRPLNLDHFMTSDCLARVGSNMHYIQGVSRLLHLIECRRDEFQLDQKVSGLTRGLASRRYRAANLKSVAANDQANSIVELDLSISIQKPDDQVASSGQTLESGTIPLSILASFTPGVSILINLFQFEAMGPDEHLSESSGSHSIYMMPLAHPGLNVALGAIQKRSNASEDVFNEKVGKSFSFKGLLTGNLFSKFYSDPIEISMSFDAELRSLAIETSFIDRGNSDGLDGWKRSFVSQLLDGQSSLKFHLMERNFGYRHLSRSGASRMNQNDNHDDVDGDQSEFNWRPCATNHLSASESKMLLDDRGDLLNLGQALYMGMALVRGIQCHVFEKRLFRLPVWFNLDTRTFDVFLESRGIYLDIFLYYNQRDEPILTRLQLRVLRKDSEALSWVLDLNSFTWSPEDFILDGSLSHRTLIERMTQNCLLLEPDARHLGVELWFKQKVTGLESSREQSSRSRRDGAKLTRELQLRSKLRDRSLVEMLSRSLKISPVQQVEFTSEISTSADGDNPLNWLLYVKFNLYELWNDLVEEEIIGHALDRSFNIHLQAATTGKLYAQGARSYSYEDCKWRAIHSLTRPSVISEYNRRDSANESEFLSNHLRLFMFCPERLICHLGDSSWLPLRQKRPLKLDNLLEFPYDENQVTELPRPKSPDINKCLVSSVIIRQQSILSKSAGLQSCRSKLEWWLESGRHGSGGGSGGGRSGGRQEADDENDDDGALNRLRLHELKYELKVRSSGEPDGLPVAGGNHAADQAAAGRSLLMEASKLRLSNRVLISNANNGADEQLATSSLLFKPLAGVAYRCLTRNSDSLTAGSAGGGGGNTGHVGKPTETSAEQNSIEPVVVLNLAECSRLCLLLHECNSFSACHQPLSTWPPGNAVGGGGGNDLGQNNHASAGRISCVFSKISWSNPSQVNQLMRLARRSSTAGHKRAGATESCAFMEVDVNAFAAGRRLARVGLELSPLCSLHARPQMNLFRLRRSHSEVQPKTEYLIYSRDVEQCARFCQERAELIRQLELEAGLDPAGSSDGLGMSGASRWAACHEFYFSADNHYCKLMPMANHWRLLKLEHLIVRPGRPKPSDAGGHHQVAAELYHANQTSNPVELIGRWRAWFQSGTPLESWTKRMASLFGESEYYELDYKQIFIVHPNHKLTFVAGQAEDRSSSNQLDSRQLQVQLSIDSRQMCAEFCLRRKGCRSFSVKLAAGGAGNGSRRNLSQCQLNAVAARDLSELAIGRNSSALAASFKFERVLVAAANSTASSDATRQDVWWHFEPSELASFMMSDPDEWRRPPPKGLAANELRTKSGRDDSDDSLELFVRPEPSLFYD